MPSAFMHAGGLTFLQHQPVSQRQLCFERWSHKTLGPRCGHLTHHGLQGVCRQRASRRTWDPLKAATGSVDPALPGEPGREPVIRQEDSGKGPFPVKLLVRFMSPTSAMVPCTPCQLPLREASPKRLHAGMLQPACVVASYLGQFVKREPNVLEPVRPLVYPVPAVCCAAAS
jgi:hypothetical protein